MGLAGKICETLPDWLPKGVHKKDWGGDYNCRIELRSTDPIENDRKRTLGSRLFKEKQVDIMTNLMNYQGYTEKEARDIIARMLVDKATLESPEIAQLLGMKYAKTHGMEEQLLALRESQELGQGRPLEEGGGGIGSQGGPPRQGNIKTAQGSEEADIALSTSGQRSSPSG